MAMTSGKAINKSFSWTLEDINAPINELENKNSMWDK